MTEHRHHHHHHDLGHAHPPAAVHASILRLSVEQRLAAVLAMIVVLWGVAVWVMV